MYLIYDLSHIPSHLYNNNKNNNESLNSNSKIAEVTVIHFTSKFLKVKVIFSFSATGPGVILADIMLVLRCLLKRRVKTVTVLEAKRNLNLVYTKT